MENTRYDYSAIVTRVPFELPGRARVALWIGVNIEYFDIGATEFATAGVSTAQPPDVFHYGPRDYGNRVGIWRLMKLLDRHGVKASVLLNSDACEHYPLIIEEGKKRLGIPGTRYKQFHLTRRKKRGRGAFDRFRHARRH